MQVDDARERISCFAELAAHLGRRAARRPAAGGFLVRQPGGLRSRDRPPHAQRLAGTAGRWSITLPSERTPVIQLEFPNAEGVSTRRFIDPANGELLPDHGSWAATGFLFPFHYSLHLRWRNVGYWLLGIAGMGMLLLLVSGVVIHRKIIREFFTFRPHKSTQRATLDLHNLTGVVALPFHFLISLSGLIIFFAIYFPTVIERIYPGNSAAFSTEAFGNYTRQPSAEPATLASLDAMRDRAREAWSDEPYMLRVWHPGDTQAYVEVRRSFARQVTMNVDRMTFDGSSGALLLDHRPAFRSVRTLDAALAVFSGRVVRLGNDRHRAAVLDRRPPRPTPAERAYRRAPAGRDLCLQLQRSDPRHAWLLHRQ